jgi:GAF domain-containing protein/HAMP domain-containing protein
MGLDIYMNQPPSTLATPAIKLPIWRQLRWNLIFAFVLVAAIPAIVVSIVTLNRARNHARTQVLDQLSSVAALKQSEINQWLNAGGLAMDTLLSDEILSTRLVSFADTQFPDSGTIIASSDALDIGKVVSNQPYYEVSLHANYVQAPIFNLGANKLVMYITRPLRGNRFEASGVLAGQLNLNTLSAIMTERTGLGETGETYLISLQNNYFLTPSRFEGYTQDRAYHSTGIDRSLASENGSGVYTAYRDAKVFGVYRWVPEVQAALLSEFDEGEALQAFSEVQNFSILLTVLAALAAVVVGLVVATSVSRPLVALTRTAQRIASGDLSQRVELRQRNEMGVLARTFNAMAAQLQDLVGNLEGRVQARTRDLQLAAQVSEHIASILDVDQLLSQVVELTRANFNLYHAHIYLLNNTGDQLMLEAGAGEPGRIMKMSQHSIPVNAERSLVARAAQHNNPVIVDDVTQEPGFLPNPLLPNTRSEAAFPVAVGSRIFGVMDVQSEQVARFDADLLAVLSTLAGQVAVALDNARLFSEVERTSRHEQALGAIIQQIQQATNVEEVLQTVVRELGRSLSVSHTQIELRLPSEDTAELSTAPSGEAEAAYTADLSGVQS